MDVNDYKFDIGDEVITVDGRRGKIVDICDCTECRKRGFSEPVWQPFDSEIEEYIPIGTAKNNFSGYHRIGKYRFNDLDKAGVLLRIDSCESELLQLREQLIFIEGQEPAFTPAKALAIVESICKDWAGNWRIPHHFKPCDDIIELNNGGEAKRFSKDEVYDFLEYIKELIIKEIKQ